MHIVQHQPLRLKGTPPSWRGPRARPIALGLLTVPNLLTAARTSDECQSEVDHRMAESRASNQYNLNKFMEIHRAGTPVTLL